MRLRNKIAIIVGGAKGIGRATALLIGSEGADVVVADRNFEQASLVSEKTNRTRKEAQGFPLKVDVTKVDDVESMVQQVVGEFGRIDILVNLAGILKVSPIIKMKDEDWDAVMAVNVKGTFLTCRTVAKEMIRQKSGKIINTASVIGKKAVAFLGHYCASKFAVIGLTQTLAIELAPYNINVNCICPGGVDTEMFEKSQRGIAREQGISYEESRKIALSDCLLSRFGKPEDLAPLVVFLASNDSSFITGQAINVCGGIQFQ